MFLDYLMIEFEGWANQVHVQIFKLMSAYSGQIYLRGYS